MASWTDYKTYDEVETPQGKGKVIRVSQAQGSAQVDINGQLFEVPLEQVRKTGQVGQGGAVPQGEIDKLLDKVDWQPPKPNLDGMFRDDIKQDVKQPEGEQDEVKFEATDKVIRKKDGAKGEVLEVTQRTVRVKFDGKPGVHSFEKRFAGNHIRKETSGDKQEPQEPQAAQPQQPQQGQTPTGEIDQLFKGILDKMNEKAEEVIDKKVDGELGELREEIKKRQQLEVKVADKVNTVTGRRHRQLETLITYSGLRLATLLVGMAGTGKTHAAEQVAEALGLNFYSMSVGAQTSKSDIIGYMDATGNYVKTFFREAYENGGIFLMDEIDAGNANVLIQVNAGLSNGLMAFPDKMVKKHEDFVFIASANTYGNGANRQYVGRNQLDAATLDRFAVLDWKIDEELEGQLAIGRYGQAWYTAVKAVRQFVADKNIRALVTPRATQKGSQMLSAGLNVDEVINATLLGSVPEDKKADVIQVAATIYDKASSDVPSGIRDDIREGEVVVKEPQLDRVPF